MSIFIFTSGFGNPRFTTQSESKETAFANVCNYINKRVESDKDDNGCFDSEHWISESQCLSIMLGEYKITEVTGSVHLSYT